jgi:hypothetical protein
VISQDAPRWQCVDCGEGIGRIGGVVEFQEVVKTIKQQQLSWAERAGIKSDEQGYCYRLDENLFHPLSSCSRLDYASGDGAELGKEGKRGKILALHSSSALACNFFDYWRGRDLTGLAQALGTTELCGIGFECKFPTGLQGTPPNLDVVLYESDGGVLAIECKLMEPFQKSKKEKTYLKPKYFEKDDTWARVKLPGCQVLADDIQQNPAQFDLLDVAQLLKHMLGLASNQRHWQLCYLWYDYDPGGPASKKHASEIVSFREQIGDDAKRFSSLTYQELFQRLSHFLGEQHLEYQEYLRDRYFGSAT